MQTDLEELMIEQAVTRPQLAAIRELFLEYQAGLGVDLCFQNFSQELAGLPGGYGPPEGRLLLGSVGVETVCCIAMRPLGDGACEMKRLYVKPRFRGCGFGRLLVARIIDEARAAGYSRMFLDTLSSMVEALSLYREFGFLETAPYYPNPLAGARYFILKL
jgi:ribosomal protein S18 acetylase RimI-like enzyme